MAGEKRAWLTIIILSVWIWGIYWPLECLLAKGFHMINDAAQCQEEAAAKHILVSKQAETWEQRSSKALFSWSYNEAVRLCYVATGNHKSLTKTSCGFSLAPASIKRESYFHQHGKELRGAQRWLVASHRLPLTPVRGGSGAWSTRGGWQQRCQCCSL